MSVIYFDLCRNGIYSFFFAWSVYWHRRKTQRQFFRLPTKWLSTFVLQKKKKRKLLTNAWCNMRSTLLVTPCTSIASDSSHSIFTRTLPRGLITCFSRRSNRMTVASYNKILLINFCPHLLPNYRNLKWSKLMCTQ